MQPSVNSTSNLVPASHIINALQNIMPDLESSYSRGTVPNIDHPTIELNNKSISAILTARKQQLDAVLHEISDVERVMDSIKNFHKQLVEQKEKIIQSMTFHKGLGSALWRLPPEILSQIFHHCLPEDNLSPASNQAPLLLTRICRPWRDVAVNTPSLWCKLYVEINLNGAGEEDDMSFYGDWEEEDVEADDRVWQQAAFLHDSWLKRSRGCPLSLVLRRYPSSKLLRNLLQPYMHQILSLSATFSRGAERPQLLLEGLSTLRELVIQEVGSSDILDITRSISQLPSTMRVLDVMRTPFDVDHISSLNPVLAHLTHVKISIRHTDALLQLLRLCPNLSSLTLQLFNMNKTLKPVTHANIQSFRVDYCGRLMMAVNLSLADLFDALSLPNLRIFEGYCPRDGPWPHEQLKHLFARSKCPLESLSFKGGVKAEAVPQAEYLALIPSLDIVVTPGSINGYWC
ncbi:hypothetical protein CY34DRAFT_812478 [Suillus luteus UH-Slu-Lm8-n1]|uniref:F-box domain-containing protein n=1 Tax=Suillus luteus UH-Slu-Lm8-n1 TaxID=930992 RepID=A0A0D0AL81_9AGAM|nr:hypothetical protein CY34DRAFT_812478 [Suillus luteus UH-Slu-Lm8-n1]